MRSPSDAAVVDHLHRARPARLRDLRAVVVVEVVVLVHRHLAPHHLAEPLRLHHVVRVGRGRDGVAAARLGADVDVHELPPLLRPARLHAQPAARPDVHVPQREMPVGRQHEPVQPVVAVRDCVCAADVDRLHEAAVVLRLVAVERFVGHVPLRRAHVGPQPEARGRDPLALRADVPEAHPEVRAHARGARHPRAGLVRRHRREQLHGNRIRVFRVRLLQVEVDVGGVVRLVHVLGRARAPHGERVAFPVPVDVEVLHHRADAVPHLHVPLVLQQLGLRRERRVVAPEHERRALAVEGEVLHPVDLHPRAVEAAVRPRRQLQTARAQAARLRERGVDGHGVMLVRLGEAEVDRADHCAACGTG